MYKVQEPSLGGRVVGGDLRKESRKEARYAPWKSKSIRKQDPLKSRERSSNTFRIANPNARFFLRQLKNNTQLCRIANKPCRMNGQVGKTATEGKKKDFTKYKKHWEN